MTLFPSSHSQGKMASSPHHNQYLPPPFAATAAPPPTPSFDSNLSSDPTNTPDFLSHLLHRLPPTLSLSGTRRSSPLSSCSTTATPPLISLSDPTPSPSLLSAATELGFFHLTHHPIPSHLPLSAESTALSLFALPPNQKQHLFPSNWPIGHEMEYLRDFTREMEKLGLKVLEELASAAGFHNPARQDLCSLLWISNGANKPDRVYPYAVGLHYQIRCQKKLTLLTDSGRVSITGPADSVFVTLGDIAQVWSNGKVKKVRGRPFPSSCNENPNSQCITMSLLITLPGESTVCPLVPDLIGDDDNDLTGNNEGEGEGKRKMFKSFSFEDYAWRIYHQRLLLKDPLLSYRA